MEAGIPKKEIRVRFAPSPTGPLNFGGARTALFNWLFVRRANGKFILRIEDTDTERSKPEYEDDLRETLTWLGLKWDEFFRQSDRLGEYKKRIEELLDTGRAYRCFCDPAKLEAERQSQLSQGFVPKYGGLCRNISKEESNKRSTSERFVIRLKVPEKKISFQDVIRGVISFDLALIGDFIIAKGYTPLYNFAAVVDDNDMKITHVIRGEEHISNTPRQITIQDAFGFPPPAYAHLPLILGHDRKKLSKRELSKSIGDYKNDGYISEAILNFLVLLGWHPEDENEILSLEDMKEKFSLERVQKAGAIFNIEKLNWLNGYYIRNMSADDLAGRIVPFIPESWLEQHQRFARALNLEKERMKKLTDFKRLGDFFFELPKYDPSLLVWKETDKIKTLKNLSSAVAVLKNIPSENFLKPTCESALGELVKKEGNGEVLWPLRAALSGKQTSPGPFDLLEALKKEESLGRINEAIKKLSDA